jgi:hypothetical protein
MSRGPGVVQRRLIAVFNDEPRRRFTIEGLAEVAFDRETSASPRPRRQK